MSQDQNTNNSCETDVCEACGSIVELGSVITADDTELRLPFSGEATAVDQLVTKYSEAAKARFSTVEINVEKKSGGSELSLRFECTAEKLIFEMGLSTIK